MPGAATYEDRWWQSADGLRLHYRDYAAQGAAGDPRPPLLCLPGLTRNARDFATLAERLAARGWRVLCAEMRGRGMSQYAPDSATYTPPHYIGDVLALLEQAGLDRVAIIGTSLGGIMAMLLALAAPQRIAGALINDIGPVIESVGLGRIVDYVSKAPRFADWPAAVAYLRAEHGYAFPGRSDAAWEAGARRVMAEDSDGTIRLDYDPAIAEPMRAAGGALTVDLWPALLALGDQSAGPRPLLLVRGGISDLLSVETFAEMQRRLPQALTATAADTGHPPFLDETDVLPALDQWLVQVAAAAKTAR